MRPPDLRTKKTYCNSYQIPKRRARRQHRLQPEMTVHLESCVVTYRFRAAALESLLYQSGGWTVDY